MHCRTAAGASPRPTGCVFRGARRPGVRSAPAVHGTYFCRGGSQTRPSHLHPWAPVYLFHGDVSPRRRRVTFATAQKSPKSRSGGGVFRFISPLKIPLFTDQSRPRKLQITRLARKGKTRSFRYSSSPNGNRLCWISIGLPFRPPYWMYPPGDEDEGRGTRGREKNAIMQGGGVFHGA